MITQDILGYDFDWRTDLTPEEISELREGLKRLKLYLRNKRRNGGQRKL